MNDARSLNDARSERKGKKNGYSLVFAGWLDVHHLPEKAFVKNSYGVTKSVVSQVHEWVVYKLGVILGSVGHRVKIHKITSSTDKERGLGDIEIKDYVVLQNPQEQTNSLPPPHTLILDFTMTHTRFGRVNFVPYYTTYSHKDSVQMVLLRLMVLCRQWSGIKYDTIIKFTSVVQTQ